MKYDDFLHFKVTLPAEEGFSYEPHEVSPLLKPHQVVMVCWSFLGGRHAVRRLRPGRERDAAGDRALHPHRGCGMGLIVIVLGVRQQFIRDAAMLGMTVTFVRRIARILRASTSPTTRACWTAS